MDVCTQRTLRGILAWTIQVLRKGKGSDPVSSAEEIVAKLFGYKRSDLFLYPYAELEGSKVSTLERWVQRRKEGEPLEYIFGEMVFYHCLLELSPAVLIPRPETEILVSHVVQHLEPLDLEGKMLWDLCCGSGCIGIALKKRFPSLTVIGSDLSETALSLAQTNARKNHADISFRQGDLFGPFNGKKAHFITCNPPYVSQSEYDELSPEIRNFEPPHAFIGGHSGLEFYERLALQLPDYLEKGGRVFLEIGSSQKEPLQRIFCHSHWKEVKAREDWAGHPRFFFLEFE